MRLAWGLIGLWSCNGELSAIGDTAGTNDPVTDPEQFYDLFEDNPNCEGFDGQPIPGATAYFVGDFEYDVEDGWVEGQEYWVLLANEAWQEHGEDDCTVTWNVQGILEETACVSCDFTMYIEARIDLDDTDCPDGLYAGEEEYEVRYDVRLARDGESEFYFTASGNELGFGVWDDGTMSYQTDGRCMFF